MKNYVMERDSESNASLCTISVNIFDLNYMYTFGVGSNQVSENCTMCVMRP